MKLKYIGILRRDGSAPSVKNGDEVIKADKNNVIDVDKSLADSLIESNLWAPEKSKGSSNDSNQTPTVQNANQTETKDVPQENGAPVVNSGSENAEVDTTQSGQDGGLVQQNDAGNPSGNPADDNANVDDDSATSTQTDDAGTIQDKAALIDYAKSLGIDAKATWGIQKLNDAIAKANAAKG